MTRLILVAFLFFLLLSLPRQPTTAILNRFLKRWNAYCKFPTALADQETYELLQKVSIKRRNYYYDAIIKSSPTIDVGEDNQNKITQDKLSA